MSYKYNTNSTLDHSSSIFGAQEIAGSQDITSYIFQHGQKSRTVSNVKSFSKQPDFLIYSQQLEKEIGKTGTTLQKLNELTNRTTLFNSEDEKINDLIVNVKESISSIQKKLMYLQSNNDLVYSKQSERMSKNIIEILNLRFVELTGGFKNSLERRTKSIKQFKEKESFFSLAGSKTSEITNRRNNKKEAAFLKKGKGVDLEESGNGYANGHNVSSPMMAQENHDIEFLKKRQDSVKSIQKALEEVGGIFTRISTMVQMHEVMIERIDKDTEDSLKHVEGGKKELVKYFKDISSMRRMIISIFIFLMIFATIYVLII